MRYVGAAVGTIALVGLVGVGGCGFLDRDLYTSEREWRRSFGELSGRHVGSWGTSSGCGYGIGRIGRGGEPFGAASPRFGTPGFTKRGRGGGGDDSTAVFFRVLRPVRVSLPKNEEDDREAEGDREPATVSAVDRR